MVEKLKFVDVNVVGGTDTEPYPHRKDRIEDLPGELERCGIEAAYVAHRHALIYDIAEGNRSLLREIAGKERLRPAWVLTPAGTAELPDVDADLAVLRENRVQLVRFYPGRHKYAFTEWCLGEWLDALAQLRMPAMLDFADSGNWEAIHRVVSSRSDLPWIVSNVNYREERNITRMLDVLPNLHLEICWYKVHLGMERLVNRFGHDRILFGSNLTEWSPGPAMAAVVKARISGEAKAAIAGGNIERLTGAVTW